MSQQLSVDRSAIHLRRKAAEIVEEANELGCEAIDLSQVEFVSRSVADELLQKSEYHDIELIGLSESVDQMIDAVSVQLERTAA